MRSAAFFIVVLTLASAACESGPATAPSHQIAESIDGYAVRPQPSGTLAAAIQHQAMLTDAGAVQVSAHLSCPFGYNVIEAFVILSQRSERISGQGGFAGIVCDGTSRTHMALVHPVEGQFRRGAANASGFILVCDTDGNCPSLSFSRRVVVRR